MAKLENSKKSNPEQKTEESKGQHDHVNLDTSFRERDGAAMEGRAGNSGDNSGESRQDGLKDASMPSASRSDVQASRADESKESPAMKALEEK